MPDQGHYHVAFFKTVENDHGRDREICQRSMELVADSEEDAVRQAIERFCRDERIRSWKDHADRYAVEVVNGRA
ncbi:hypothetical protein ACUN0C_14960 [Faunimonas sp. B44]|uniref:hypothetical protein n=1 Tax=Faunimonas sp. B44 TaxID=3461493 RepID=UPI0040440394